MEELLNKLIKKWRKPFWRETKHELSSWVVYDTIDIKWKGDIRVIDRRHHHIRELVSKESGLRQFVCDNGLLNVNKKYEWEYWTQSYKRNWEEYTHEFSRWCENYRIIESSLKDEKDLEDFLLENIKIQDDE